MRFQLSNGNIILADQAFIDQHHPDAVALPDDPAPAAPRHITVGAFFDRFGAHKYPILASVDAGVQALIKDSSVREYIDLDNPQLAAGLQLLISAGFAIDAASIVDAPIEAHEQA